MRATILLAVVCVAAHSTAAQSPGSTDWPLTDGSRVRVVALGIGNGARTGTLVSTSPDSMVIQEPKNVAFRVATKDVVKLEVVRGQQTHKLMGTVIGFLGGAALGAILGAATYRPSKCPGATWCLDFGEEFNVAGGAVVGAGAGTLIGLMIGAAPRDKWAVVTVPSR